MKSKKKLFEDLQITGLGLLIVSISVVFLFKQHWDNEIILIMTITGIVFAGIGYTLNWISSGPAKMEFWTNLLSYLLIILFILGIKYRLHWASSLSLYGLAIGGSLTAGIHIARQLKHISTSGNESKLFSLNNILMLSATALFIIGLMLDNTEIKYEMIILGFIIFLTWSFRVRKV